MIYLKFLLGVLFVIVAGTHNVLAGDCRKTGSSCIDATPCKVFNGKSVCLNAIGESCWKYNDTYECKEPSGPDYCGAIASAPGCYQFGGSPCTEGYAWDGTCLGYTQTYRCAENYTGSGVIHLDTSYTIVGDSKDYAACASLSNNPSCSPTGGEVCVQEGNLTPDGPWGCLKYEKTYTCRVSTYADYCSPLASVGCTEESSVCAPGGYAYDGTCIDFKKRYRCDNKQGEPLPPFITYLGATYDIVFDNKEAPECADEEANEQCKLAGETCVEPAETRNINGLNVYKDCWKWNRDYTCVVAQYENKCQVLEDNSTCVVQPNPTCKYTAWNGSCLQETKVFNCDDEFDPPPTGVIHLDDNYTIVFDDTDPSECLALEDNPNCEINGTTCIEGPETRNINGLDVHKDCWRWENTYTCASGSPQSNCPDLEGDPNCMLSKSGCIDYLDTGECSTTEKEFTCTVGTPHTSTVTTCGSPPDGDFAQATAMMEIGRQAGVYQDDAGLLFSGTASKCREKLFATCCKIRKPDDPGSRNADQYAAFAKYPSITGAVTQNATKFMGSTYVHDILFVSDLVPDKLLNFMYGGKAGGAGTSPGLSYYGVTVTYGASGFQWGFDPTSLALQLAINFIIDIISCGDMSQQEQLLALRRGANLCHHPERFTYCSKKTLFGICLEHKQSWCCYNSKLAKAINTQGRAQLGKSFGSAKDPDCSGFSASELSSLNFAAMNLDELYQDIIDNMKPDYNGNLSASQATVTDNVLCKTESGGYNSSYNYNCNKYSGGRVLNTGTAIPEWE